MAHMEGMDMTQGRCSTDMRRATCRLEGIGVGTTYQRRIIAGHIEVGEEGVLGMEAMEVRVVAMETDTVGEGVVSKIRTEHMGRIEEMDEDVGSL